MTITDSLANVKKEGKYIIQKEGGGFSLSRKYCGKDIEIKLTPLEVVKNRKIYKVIFPTYLFTSRISHFAPVDEEKRLCRNKSLLLSFMKMANRTGLIKFIDRNFITVNEDNKRSNKRELWKILKNLV